MAKNVDFEAEIELEIPGGSCAEPEEWVTYTFTFDLRCTLPYRPAQLYGLPEHCYPAEGPEFEIVGIWYRTDIMRETRIGWDDLIEMVGLDKAYEMFEKAHEQAADSGDF